MRLLRLVLLLEKQSCKLKWKLLNKKKLLEREELILRQRRKEQQRELRQDIEERQRALQQSIEEVEEQQRALEKSREEEIRKLQSQREEWEIMNRKRILQKKLDIKCAAIESDNIDKISERSFSISGRSKHKASTTKSQPEPSTSKLEAPNTSKFEAVSLAVSTPLPEKRHSANQPAEQVNFKPTVGFNICPVATSEDELQASFQSMFPKLPEPRKTPTSAPFVSSTSQMHPTLFLAPLHSQQQVIPSIASLKLPLWICQHFPVNQSGTVNLLMLLNQLLKTKNRILGNVCIISHNTPEVWLKI